MSLEGHLAELERRHDALDRDITREWGRPSVDEVKLAESSGESFISRTRSPNCGAASAPKRYIRPGVG